MSTKPRDPQPTPPPPPDLPPLPPVRPLPGPPTGPTYAELHSRIAYLEARCAHLAEQRERFRQLAHTDQLTGALNRHGLADFWWRVHPEHRLALVDVDRFKAVNDTLGHAAGDTVLAGITASLRKHGTVARLGGDELAVIGAMPDGPDRMWRVPIEGGRVLTVTGTIGLTSVVPGDLAETLRRADVAMYQAKKAARGSLMAYDPSLDAQAPVSGRRRVRDALPDGVITVPVAPCCETLPGDCCPHWPAGWPGPEGWASVVPALPKRSAA